MQNQQKRLVVVDDEEMVIASIRNYLILETDYEVLSFTSPLQALEEIKKNPVSVAISDFLMPEMDGLNFLNKVREIYPKSTLILLTGYADKENAIKAINELGIYKYIEKPWSNEDLKLTIDNAIERSDLINKLENKVNELNIAQEELKKHSNHLEDLVKERTEKLYHTNAELNAIIESSADGIFTMDSNHTITSVNTALEKLSGLKRNAVLNKNFNDFLDITYEEDTLFSKENQQIRTSRNCRIYNTHFERYIPVEISIAPIMEEKHNIRHEFVVVVRDITAQKEYERLREDFVATLTHDLRTPLVATIQTLDFFLDGSLGNLNPKQEKFLDTMKNSNKDLLALVNGLLEVYKFESGSLNLIKNNFELNELINTCIEEFHSLTQKKNLNIDFQNKTTKSIISGDRKELKRVVANLLANAINYTPNNGDITIILHYVNSNIEVIVQDTGRGIPEQDQKKLFQRFSQGTSKQRSTGTGLGLYLSRQIVEAHGGKVWVKSKDNDGSRFGFTIPLNEIEVQNDRKNK